MADPYLAIAEIASNQAMIERMNAAASQEAHATDNQIGGQDPINWVHTNRFLWASLPSWGEKWRFAEDSNPDDPDYDPGRDEAVITDADILAAVQTLSGTA